MYVQLNATIINKLTPNKSMKSEDLYIKNIENAIRALRLRSKTPQNLNIGTQFTKLKPLNEGIHDELMTKYKTALEVYNKQTK